MKNKLCGDVVLAGWCLDAEHCSGRLKALLSVCHVKKKNNNKLMLQTAPWKYLLFEQRKSSKWSCSLFWLQNRWVIWGFTGGWQEKRRKMEVSLCLPGSVHAISDCSRLSSPDASGSRWTQVDEQHLCILDSPFDPKALGEPLQHWGIDTAQCSSGGCCPLQEVNVWAGHEEGGLLPC